MHHCLNLGNLWEKYISSSVPGDHFTQLREDVQAQLDSFLILGCRCQSSNQACIGIEFILKTSCLLKWLLNQLWKPVEVAADKKSFCTNATAESEFFLHWQLICSIQPTNLHHKAVMSSYNVSPTTQNQGMISQPTDTWMLIGMLTLTEPFRPLVGWAWQPPFVCLFH